MEQRILILALRGRDAAVIAQTLTRHGHACRVCTSCEDLTEQLALGAAAALVTEESLTACDTSGMQAWLADQPTWSDFPFILLSTKRSGSRPREARHLLEVLGNVVVLERPIHSETILSAVDSAQRGRRRQYEARRHLANLHEAEETLRQLNGTLESRIEERTRELARANDMLMQEIAERERAQAALVQSQKMEAVGQLTGGIAHDFNNLLTAISGNLELIQRKSGDEKLSNWAGYGLQATGRAAKLTRQLLAFSRTQKLSLEPVEVNALIRNMNELLLRSLGPEYDLTIKLDPQEPWAMADVNQLELAILNLALNARDAMPNGGPLRIECGRAVTEDGSLPEGEYVVIKVADSGPGIPEHLVDKVFDPFFTTKPVGKGTGLGLSQVYGIAHQSGGAARIDSRPGKGCTVEIWLPRIAAGAQPDNSAAAPDPERRKVRRNILVIEDDPGVRRFIVECLQTLGHTVQEAAHGQEGLDQLSGQSPDLVIVDYAMPGLNGVEVIQAAREDAPDLRFLMATGYADMEAVSRVIEEDQVLRKPFQIVDLERAINRVMGQAGEPAGGTANPS